MAVGKKTVELSLDAHLNDDEAIAKMGHPVRWLDLMKQILPLRGRMTNKCGRMTGKKMLKDDEQSR